MASSSDDMAGMTLAEATSALTRMNTEILPSAMEAMNEISTKMQQGYAGQLTLSVHEVRLGGALVDASRLKVEFKVSSAAGESISAEGLADNEVSVYALQQPADFVLLSKEKTTAIIVCNISTDFVDDEETAESDASTQQYSASFSCEDAPEDSFIQTELDAIGSTSSGGSATVLLRAHFDRFEGALVRKKMEVEQAEERVKDLGQHIRDLSGSGGGGKLPKKGTVASSPSKKGKSGSNKQGSGGSKSKKGSGSNEVSTKGNKGSLTQKIVRNVLIGLQVTAEVAINHRAIWLFGLSAVGIYFFGDHASV